MKKGRIWRLASDVKITPVEELPEEFIEKVTPYGDIPEGHFGIERKKARALPRIVNRDVVDVLNAFGEKGATYEDVLDRFLKERNLEYGELHPKMQKMVQAFIKSSFLVDGGDNDSKSAESVEPSFKEGDRWLSYKILENIHCIIDSEIYKVEDVSSGGLKALKIMQSRFPNNEMREKVAYRLKNEFDLLHRINHPNIVKIWEHGTHAGRTYGILDWVDGPSVRSHAHRSDNPATDTILIELAVQCLEALNVVHKAGYLHGDVHTGNFLIRNGCVCLIDFGLARPIEIKKDEKRKYAEGGVVHYLPPEYVRRAFDNKKGLWGSVAGEIYSCGVMLFALFTRRYPYEWSFYRKDYMKRILDDPPLSFEECERDTWPELERLLRKAMAKNPKDRFASIEEFMKELKEVTVPHPGSAGSSEKNDRQA